MIIFGKNFSEVGFLQLKDLSVIYINNPLSFSSDVDTLLESIFNDYFDIGGKG